MSNLVRDVCVYIVVGVLIHSVSVGLQSDFLEGFLEENLVTLLFALLAINTTTMSVILTKLRDIANGSEAKFARTMRAMRRSVIEQLVLIIVAGMTLVAKNSGVVCGLWACFPFILNVILIAVFAWALHVLYDTANGVFVILRHEEGS